MDANDITNRFVFHPAKGAQRQTAHGRVRETLLEAARKIDMLVPEGREKSLAITKLEEAMMWANAGIARQPDESPLDNLSSEVGRREGRRS